MPSNLIERAGQTLPVEHVHPLPAADERHVQIRRTYKSRRDPIQLTRVCFQLTRSFRLSV